MLDTSKKKRLDPNLIIAIGVLLASLGALVVSTRQASIMNRQTQILLNQSKSSAWPSLSIELYRGFGEGLIQEYRITVSNRGTGPAIIERVIISYDGQSVPHWDAFMQLIELPDSISGSRDSGSLFHRVIRPNEDVPVIDLSFNPGLMQYFYKNGEKITFQICYKSVYDEYWLVQRNGFQTNLEAINKEIVDKCPATEGVEFRG